MRIRLDLAIEQRGLLPSRARARDAILRGAVTVNGAPAQKPHQPVADDDLIVLDDPASAYVSRAALKLVAGLDAASIDVSGRTCLDLGASTGGFTQVLLKRGARKIFSVDVGHGQLHAAVGADPRVAAMEGINARDLTPALVPEEIDLIVCDVSFVSLTKILDAPLRLCAPAADAVLLIKPQFEAGRRSVGRGGLVKDEAAIAEAIVRIVAFMDERGWREAVRLPSPIAGGDGNREIIAGFSRRAG